MRAGVIDRDHRQAGLLDRVHVVIFGASSASERTSRETTGSDATGSGQADLRTTARYVHVSVLSPLINSHNDARSWRCE
jgi:hypothetical protein